MLFKRAFIIFCGKYGCSRLLQIRSASKNVSQVKLIILKQPKRNTKTSCKRHTRRTCYLIEIFTKTITNQRLIYIVHTLYAHGTLIESVSKTYRKQHQYREIHNETNKENKSKSHTIWRSNFNISQSILHYPVDIIKILYQ